MIVQINNNTVKLPDFIIAGAAKAGSTTLTYFLKQHPLIEIPVKEPGFFAFYDVSEHLIDSDTRKKQIVQLDKYLELYKDIQENKIIGDASVVYLNYAERSIKNIKKIYGDRVGDLKIILILRHPVDRAFSNYMMLVRNGIEKLEFSEAIKPEIVQQRISRRIGYDYLGNSMYADKLESIINEFPKTKILFSEDLKNPELVLNAILNFLDADDQHNINTNLHLNPSGVPKNQKMINVLRGDSLAKRILKKIIPDNKQHLLINLKSKMYGKMVDKQEIDPELRKQLTDYFYKDIQKTQLLTGRDLSHWTNLNKT